MGRCIRSAALALAATILFAAARAPTGRADIIVESQMYQADSFAITWRWDESNPEIRTVTIGFDEDTGLPITEDFFVFLFG